MFERSTQGAVSVISTRDPLSGPVVEELREISNELLVAGQPMLVFDMSEMPLISGTGLELLLDMKQSFLRRGGNLKIAAPNSLCRDVFRITGVADHFEIHGGLNEAVGSFVK